MASKASMLKQGANKTGKGLFAGMSRLDAREEAPSGNTEITSDIVKEEKSTETVNVPKKESVQVTPVEVKVEEPVEEAPVIEEPKAENPVVEKIQVQDEVINDKINKSEKTEKIEPQTKNPSRYEKEKFLLLDIRGYRDYVEHMAKASNMSATKYIRNLIQMDMDKNREIYEEHKAFEEKLRELWKKSAEKEN